MSVRWTRDMYTRDASSALLRAYKRHNITPAEAIDIEAEFSGQEAAILTAIHDRTAYVRPDAGDLRYHASNFS